MNFVILLILNAYVNFILGCNVFNFASSSNVFKHQNAITNGLGVDHEMDWENMEILDSARDDYRLRLKEMLYINKLKPELNLQKSSQMFSLLLNQGNGS